MGGLGITGIFCLVSPTLSAPTSGRAIGGGAFPVASPVRDFPPGIMVFTPLSPSSSHSSLSDNPKRERKALKSSSATEYYNCYYRETWKMCIFYIKNLRMEEELFNNTQQCCRFNDPLISQLHFQSSKPHWLEKMVKIWALLQLKKGQKESPSHAVFYIQSSHTLHQFMWQLLSQKSMCCHVELMWFTFPLFCDAGEWEKSKYEQQHQQKQDEASLESGQLLPFL